MKNKPDRLCGMEIIMREMEFTMSRPNLVKVGEEVEILSLIHI